MAELGTCDKVRMACKAQTIHSPAFYRKSLPNNELNIVLLQYAIYQMMPLQSLSHLIFTKSSLY